MSLTYQSAPRSSLYFGQYEYSAHLHITNINLIRDLSEKVMRDVVHHRTVWGTWRNWQHSARPTEAQLQSLADWIDPLIAVRTHSKLMFYTHWLYVYTNDTAALNWLTSHPDVRHSSLYRAELSVPTDVIFLRQPRHPWRSYLRPGWLQPQQHQALLRFVTARPNNFYITPGFRSRLESAQHRLYLQNDVFIEHSTPQDLTMLSLVLPQCIKRTVQVQAK